MKITELPDEHRFALYNDANEEIGQMTWQDKGDYFVINHTIVSPDYGGRGLAGKLVAEGVAKARREGRKILPTCSFAVRAFDKTPEYQDVLKK